MGKKSSGLLLAFAALAAACTAPADSQNPPETPPAPTLGAIPWPTPATAEFDPAQFGWLALVDELDANSSLVRHWLNVGLLSSDEPAGEIPLAESPWQFSIFAVQKPVVAGPVHGQVLYIADDGTESELRLATVDGLENRSIGSIPEVVFEAALSSDGRYAYIVALDRSTGRDLGVFRHSIDGAEPAERIMDPAPRDLAVEDGDVVLAAVQRFVRNLALSSDGSALARFACGEPFGTCVLDIAELAVGTVSRFEEPPVQAFYGVAAGVVVADFQCEVEPCAIVEVLDVASGLRRPLIGQVGTYVGVAGDGSLVLIGQIGGTYYDLPPAELWGTDVSSGAMRLLLDMDGAFGLGVDYPERQAVELPWGWVLVSICTQTDPCEPVAYNLSDGRQVPARYGQSGAFWGPHD